MLHIIWLLLKIIGWILLGILAILILLLCILLFTAFQYQADAISKGGKDSVKMRLKISWFFRMVRVVIKYDGGKLQYNVRIFKKSFSDRSEGKKTEREPGKAKAEFSDKPKVQEIREDSKKMEPQKNIKASSEPEIWHEHIPEPDDQDEIQETKEMLIVKETGKFKKLKDKIFSFFKKIKYTLSQICDKMKALSGKKERVLDFFRDTVHKKAFQKGKSVALHLLRILKPKCFQANVIFGFEDPSVTGKVLAGAALLYPFTGDGLELQPDFEHAVLKGKIYVKGKLRPVSFLVQGLRLLLDKQVRQTWRDARKFMDVAENVI